MIATVRPGSWPAAGGPSTSRATRCGTTIRHASSTNSRISSASSASSHASIQWKRRLRLAPEEEHVGPRRRECGAFLLQRANPISVSSG